MTEMDEREFGQIAAVVSDPVGIIVRECVEEYGVESIHTLVAKLRWHVLDRIKEYGPKDLTALELMALFERAMVDGDKFLQEGIALSLVEGSDWMDPELHSLFGPNLKSEWERQVNWKP